MAAEEVTITVQLRAMSQVPRPYTCVDFGSDGYIGCQPTGFPVFGISGTQYVLADGREVLNCIRAASVSAGRTGSFLNVHLFHMRGSDDELLKDATYPIISYDMEQGWLVHCNRLWLTDAELEKAEEAGYSKEFLDVLRIARDAGVNYAWFDPDTDPEPGRPTFEFVVSEE